MTPDSRSPEVERSTPVQVRPATPADAARLWPLVVDFARFDEMEELLTGSPERLAANLAGAAWPRIDGFVAESGEAVVGYAIFYGVYSTFWTLPMVWLEDLFVVEAFRAKGVGRMLFAAVARAAVERGCPRMGWAVLDWNREAIGFYERIGAARHSGTHEYRLDGEGLRAVAGAAPE